MKRISNLLFLAVLVLFAGCEDKNDDIVNYNLCAFDLSISPNIDSVHNSDTIYLKKSISRDKANDGTCVLNIMDCDINSDSLCCIDLYLNISCKLYADGNGGYYNPRCGKYCIYSVCSNDTSILYNTVQTFTETTNKIHFKTYQNGSGNFRIQSYLADMLWFYGGDVFGKGSTDTKYNGVVVSECYGQLIISYVN